MEGPMATDINKLTDDYYEVKTRISALTSEANDLKKTLAEIEGELIHSMEDSKLDQVRNANATFSIKTEVLPVAKDWDAIYGYIKENDAFHLLQRRVSSLPYREILSMGDEVPGIERYEATKLTMRKR